MRGGGATEIIAQARAGLSQIATGSYVGTGSGYKTDLVIPFNPTIIYVYSPYIYPKNTYDLLYSMFCNNVFSYIDERLLYVGDNGGGVGKELQGLANNDFINFAITPEYVAVMNRSGGSLGSTASVNGLWVNSYKVLYGSGTYTQKTYSIRYYLARTMSYDDSAGVCSLRSVEYQWNDAWSSVSSFQQYFVSHLSTKDAMNIQGCRYNYIAIG